MTITNLRLHQTKQQLAKLHHLRRRCTEVRLASQEPPSSGSAKRAEELGEQSFRPVAQGSSSINLREHGVKASEAAESCENSYFQHRLIGLIDEPFRALNARRPCYRARTRL